MLNLTKQGLMSTAMGKADSDESGLSQPLNWDSGASRPLLGLAASTAIGGGLVYFAAKHHNRGWWPIATALGAINLFNNGRDILNRVATKTIGA